MRTLILLLCGAALAAGADVERWGLYEVTLAGPAAGNPFVEVQVGARFSLKNRVVDVDGFYDGAGTYRVRFMPDALGEWTYTTRSNRESLSGKSGSFRCVSPSSKNHGPVVVRNTFHFGYADGAPYFPVGTTSYAWAHQGDKLEAQTLETLRSAPFNKIRMCVFPKDYAYNKNEPVYYPFPRDVSGVNDYARFDVEFFRHFEKRVGQLMELGIEADLILFHPYDRWGYQKMPAEVDDRYLRYVVARLAAYRNVWWSMANEWDFMKSKTQADFDRYFKIVQASDPYQHLRSIHNGTVIYDHAKPWVTHASIQSSELEKIPEWLKAYGKPVVMDECQYEGNIPRRWGNISAQEMVRRFWLGTAQGAYVGHGETYIDPRDILWWGKGGVLHGESPARIAFLRKIIETFPAEGLNPIPNPKMASAYREGVDYLFYLDAHQPAEWEFELPSAVKFRAEVIDPWGMTVTAVDGRFSGKFTMGLPGKPYLAIRFRGVK